MAEETAMAEIDASIVAKIVLEGDLSSLAPDERLKYYTGLCRSLKLNPLTKPFDYLQLSGKLVLYANKDCAQQLVRNHRLSLQILSQGRLDGDIYMVTVRATSGTQTVDAVGVTNVYNLRGDQLANSIMKCCTKASRRATLAIVGLGILDETEVDTIPNAAVVDVDYSTGEIKTAPPIAAGREQAVVVTSNAGIAHASEDMHPLLLNCPTHDVAWEQKTGKYGEFKSHKNGSKWCNFNKIMKGLLADLAKATDQKLPILSKLGDEEVVALHDAWQTAPVAEEIADEEVADVSVEPPIVDLRFDEVGEPPQPEIVPGEVRTVEEPTPPDDVATASDELDTSPFELQKGLFIAWLKDRDKRPEDVKAVLQAVSNNYSMTVSKWMESQASLWEPGINEEEKWERLRAVCLTAWGG